MIPVGADAQVMIQMLRPRNEGLALWQDAVEAWGLSEWERFRISADAEGVSAYLYRSLMACGGKAFIPETVWTKMEQAYLINFGRNLLLDQELDQVCTRLEQVNIQALLVRGAAFLRTLYMDQGVRPLIDMDFVVREEDFPRVQEELKALGFSYHDAYPYFVFKDDVYIDLHLDSINFWRLQWPSHIRLSNQTLWERTKDFDRFHAVRLLSNEDMFCHCAEHLLRHGFSRLIWFVDMMHFITKSDFDWDCLVGRAKELNAVKPVFYVLSYLHHWQLAEVPEMVRVQCAKPMNFLERKSLQKLLADRRQNISGELLSLCTFPTMRQRISVGWRAMMVDPAKFPLVNERLTFRKYVSRIVRLIYGNLYKMISFMR